MRGCDGEKRGRVGKVAHRFRPTHVAAPLLCKGCPNLDKATWRIRSPFDDGYQCIAWAAFHTDRHMWPHQNYWWFPGMPLFPIDTETPVSCFVEGFSSIGY